MPTWVLSPTSVESLVVFSLPISVHRKKNNRKKGKESR